MRLIFVDDEATILRAYQRAFARDHHVVLATNGTEALAAFVESADFDFVICDIAMPAMTGIQLYEIVRERFPALAERFIFATGGSAQREVDAFLRAVPNRVLVKPFDLSVLRELIDELGRLG